MLESKGKKKILKAATHTHTQITHYVQKHNATSTADFLSEIMKATENGMASSK